MQSSAYPRLLALSPNCPEDMRGHPWAQSRFLLMKEIGSGAASLVYKATCLKTCRRVAIKMYKKAKLSVLNRRQVEREIMIHSSLTHPNVIDFYAAFEDEEWVCLVQELAEGGDLFDEVKRKGGRLPERDVVQRILYPYLCVLLHLHDRGIIHRDIKPENTCFVDAKVLKVIDFGLAISAAEERPVTRLGTLDYMAPEVLRCPDKHKPSDNKERSDLAYDASVDAWAIGVLAYELTVGRPPFGMANRESTMRAIQAANPLFPEWVSVGARDFISQALQKPAASRAGVAKLVQHPWVAQHIHDLVLSRQPPGCNREALVRLLGKTPTAALQNVVVRLHIGLRVHLPTDASNLDSLAHVYPGNTSLAEMVAAAASAAAVASSTSSARSTTTTAAAAAAGGDAMDASAAESALAGGSRLLPPSLVAAATTMANSTAAALQAELFSRLGSGVGAAVPRSNSFSFKSAQEATALAASLTPPANKIKAYWHTHGSGFDDVVAAASALAENTAGGSAAAMQVDSVAGGNDRASQHDRISGVYRNQQQQQQLLVQAAMGDLHQAYGQQPGSGGASPRGAKQQHHHHHHLQSAAAGAGAEWADSPSGAGLAASFSAAVSGGLASAAAQLRSEQQLALLARSGVGHGFGGGGGGYQRGGSEPQIPNSMFSSSSAGNSARTTRSTQQDWALPPPSAAVALYLQQQVAAQQQQAAAQQQQQQQQLEGSASGRFNLSILIPDPPSVRPSIGSSSQDSHAVGGTPLTSAPSSTPSSSAPSQRTTRDYYLAAGPTPQPTPHGGRVLGGYSAEQLQHALGCLAPSTAYGGGGGGVTTPQVGTPWPAQLSPSPTTAFLPQPGAGFGQPQELHSHPLMSPYATPLATPLGGANGSGPALPPWALSPRSTGEAPAFVPAASPASLAEAFANVAAAAAVAYSAAGGTPAGAAANVNGNGGAATAASPPSFTLPSPRPPGTVSISAIKQAAYGGVSCGSAAPAAPSRLRKVTRDVSTLPPAPPCDEDANGSNTSEHTDFMLIDGQY